MRRRFFALLREPLVQFLLLGFLIYAGVSHHEQSAAEDRRTIRITAAVEGHLQALFEARYGYPADDRTLSELVTNYIEDEVLYREALQLGLAAEDEIIRRRLIQKMDFLLREPADVPEDPTLKEYYQRHSDRFSEPVRISFRHLYFSPEAGGEAAAADRAASALAAFKEADPKPPLPAGDPFPLEEQYKNMDRSALLRIFGQTPFASDVFTAPIGGWSGPFRSGYGWHLVQVQERTGGVAPDFEAVRDAVIDAYTRERMEEKNRERREELRARYSIVRDREE